MLVGAGYSVATCAEQAERFAQLDGCISLLIADVAAPCSGIAVSGQLKTSMPLLKFVLTSGYPVTMWSYQDTALYDALPTDSVRVLLKPFRPIDILAAVRSLIGSSADATRCATVG